jgi:alkylation response protein AidB-like acyl-CoA dehydrogenase
MRFWEETGSMFDTSEDQELFQETTRRFLEAEAPVTKLRALAGSKEGYEPDYWRRGAELGWTSLVVPEDSGGGSVSGSGVLDLLLLSYEFGRHAAPGPLGPTNVVAAALGRWGTAEQKSGPLAGLISGDNVAAWAVSEASTGGGFGEVALVAEQSGQDFVLRGTKNPVEAGAQADWFLVTARDDGGLSQFLVPADAPGITVTPLHGLDMTRRYAQVDFEAVRVPESSLVGRRGNAGDEVEWLIDLAVVIQLAEMVGAMQWTFDITLEWSFNRYSFGRPLASYQEIKHRFADMKMWLEGSYAITEAAARALDEDAGDRSQQVSAGKFYVGRYGSELVQDCVQLHGGIGVTFDHDIHIFLRRLTTDLPVYGAPADHAARIVTLLEA